MNPASSDPARSQVLFQTAFAGFQRASENGVAVLERFYTVAGQLVCLRFAGPALVSRLTPALEHLACSPGPSPALTVCLWDSESTGVPLPVPPDLPSNTSSDDSDSGIVLKYGISGALSLLDARQKLAVYWVADPERLPYYECGAPLLTIFYWWLRLQEMQVVHAAAVGTNTGGVLLIGKGGSGKSTTAKACLGSPLLYAGDDYCAVQIDPSPYVHSLYSSGKVCAPDVSGYPHLEAALSNRVRLPEEKALYFLAPHLPDALCAGFPLRAILLPRITGRPTTRTFRVSPAASLLALAPSTLFQLPHAGDGDFGRLGSLVRRVPSYVLELGTDLTALPDTILRVLAENL